MTVNRDLVNMLSKSKRLIGEVLPIIVDYDGEVLSGHHRKAAGWLRTHRVDTRKLAEKWGVTPLMAKDILRLHMNIQRKPSRKETQFLVRRMALCLKDVGVPEEKIAAELPKYVPYSHKYILELLPEKYKEKEKVEAAKAGVPVRLSRTEEVKVIKAPETWEYRKARMAPRVSKMDEAVYLELQRGGWDVEFQREYCLVSTIVDLKINRTPDGQKVNAAVYLDGEEVHAKREERDEALRELLSNRHNLRVVSIPYKRFSRSELNRVVQQIREAVSG